MNNNILNGNVNKRNWKQINYGKTKQIMLFMDKSILDKEKNRLKILNCNKEGAKFRYSNELIEFLVMIQNYFKLDFRKLMAFCRLFNQSLKIPCPDYSTINRWKNKLQLLLKNIKKNKQKLIIAVDGTGLATTNRGEWLRYIHKKGLITKRNGFVKLLISVDISTQEIVGIKVFDDSQGEVIYLTDVLLQSIQNKNQPINTLLADGSYDKYNIFEMLQQAGVLPIINIRKNTDLMLTEDTDKFKTRRRKIDNKLPVRTLVAREQLKDKENWKKDNGYGQRWTVEYVFSAFKRLFGQAITSRKKENVENELIAKANLYNLLLKC